MSWLNSSDEGEIRWLTINRPERRNAIPFDGFPHLRDHFREFERSDQRVLVVTGAGGAFCAGADLNPDGREELSSVVDRHRRMKVIDETATALHRITKPTIAAVDGVAVGAGMNLALGCDVVVAAESARFSEIFVRRGLTVDFGGTWLLPRIVGLQRAKELALSGRMIEADEALRLGLVIAVVAIDGLADHVRQIATGFLSGAPVGQMFTKQALNASFEMSFAEAVSWESQSQAIALGTEDSTEGIEAFLEKRDPNWRGR
ncbi:MAG: enoyl-CoA hydratase-related protein [Acidimicrobiia bacterium]